MKDKCFKFLKFCSELALYPTKNGYWISQTAQDENGERMVFDDEGLWNAFENDKLEELLKNSSVKRKVLDNENSQFPKKQVPYKTHK